MKPHHFDKNEADPNDIQLKMAIGQGYVPSTCLLGGHIVMSLMNSGEDPCNRCNGPREKCGGRPKRD